MKKSIPFRLISTVLVLTMLIGLSLATDAADPIDSASDWARDAIMTATANGYVPYDIRNNYKKVITRAEFCRMAVMYVEYATGLSADAIMMAKGVSRDPDAFSDTSAPYILAAHALGIANGTDSEKRLFSPDGEISREQAATMIMNTCMVIGIDVSNPPISGFVDMSSAAEWAVDSISFCYANKIMNGTNVSPLSFSPKETYTREQSIMTFNNIDTSGIIEQTGIVTVYGVNNTQEQSIRNWGSVSSVQQFAYKNEGLAYAYIKDDNLQITTPKNTFIIEMKYPILGDVISDDDGNFYMVWGKEGTSYKDETIFISKYTSQGVHVKTVGFTGESVMGQDGNTKIPFDAGNCVSAIGEGYLMVNYAREMYNGHQSNNVIGVKLSDMSPVKWESKWDIPYTSHSFNQSIIWSKHAGGFVYADHGDAYGRGFVITSDVSEMLLFHFYLEANANYNMWIVNKTFAQLGGLAETSKGVVLVGASAKSISESAKEEKQNLFVQIFDPLSTEVSSSMFVGGTTRSGAMSFDINDNKNKPHTSVTDYGVHWLTNYSDMDVVAPQVIVVDDKIVIMWSTYDGKYETVDDTFYMILSASGEVLIPATSLGAVPLNSFEQPMYYNGAVYWVAVSNGRLMIRSIRI